MKLIIDTYLKFYDHSEAQIQQLMNVIKNLESKRLQIELKMAYASRLMVLQPQKAIEHYESLVHANSGHKEILLNYFLNLLSKNKNADSLDKSAENQIKSVLKRFMETKPNPKTLNFVKRKLDDVKHKNLLKFIDNCNVD